jgi:hypothetical protein
MFANNAGEVVTDTNPVTCASEWCCPAIGPQESRSPGPTRDAAPAGEPVPGTEGTVLGCPTRGKGEPASTRRQAFEGRFGGPALRRGNHDEQHHAPVNGRRLALRRVASAGASAVAVRLALLGLA